MFKTFVLAVSILFSFNCVAENSFDYQLQPIKVADDTYAFIGKKEDFSEENGGNIVNTGFIVTDKGVVVIDTGPSLIYGQQMRAAIADITNKPIVKVLLTHHHPDHIFGNQAFKGVPTYALAKTTELINNEAPGFLDNLYRMVGYWMKDTEVTTDIKVLEQETESFNDHQLQYLNLSGHTDGDLVIYDETTGVLFTGDLVFHNRALTTPHATPQEWKGVLEKIAAIDFKVLVPGHGEVSQDKQPITQTLDYMNWLETTIENAVNQGMEMNEVMNIPIPERFQSLDVVQHEFTRSITHRYPYYEDQIFQ